MSFLMVDQLENNDVISFNMKLKKDMVITNIRLGIYKKGTITGNLTLRLKDLSGNVLVSKTLGTTDFASIYTYFHGKINFEFTETLIKKQEITVEIELNDYTNSDTNYIALVKNPEPTETVFGVYTPSSIVAKDIWLNPYAIEVYTY